MSQGSCHPREISPWLLDFPSGCSTSKVASWGSCWAAVLGLKLTYRYLIGLLQGVHNVVLESLSYVKAKHHLKMKLHAVAERRPTFGGSLGMWDSKDILPKHLCHLGLYDFLPTCQRKVFCRVQTVLLPSLLQQALLPWPSWLLPPMLSCSGYGRCVDDDVRSQGISFLPWFFCLLLALRS